MRNRLFVFLLYSAALSAQSPVSAVCGNPLSQIDLYGNGLRARVLGAGDFGWDLSNGVYLPNYNPVNPSLSPGTIFLGGLWYGGADPAGNLVLKATNYRSDGNTSFYAGPLDPLTGTTEEFTCANWDRHFRVTSTEVNDFLIAGFLSR